MPKLVLYLVGVLSCVFFAQASQFPYERRFTNGTTPVDEENDVILDRFLAWLRASFQNHNVADPSGGLFNTFVIKGDDKWTSFDDLYEKLASNHYERNQLPKTIWDAIPAEHIANMSAAEEAQALFGHLNFELDPDCLTDRSKYWYRTADGSCNWLKKGEAWLGSTFQPRSRDFNQHDYADGVAAPRQGPNPRELSNAFFKRKERLSYEHTPLMLGLVEFLMHDVSYTVDATAPHPPRENEIVFEGPSTGPEEYIDIPIPDGDESFGRECVGNRTFRVWRTKAAAGTGTSKENPREHENAATAWLDASALYGSTQDVADALRTFKDGKLKSQIGNDGREYLPFNNGPKALRMKSRPGIDMATQFMGGDPRTNEDWIMVSVHTLLLREHNRLCSILLSQHSDWDDERIYQTARLVMGSKMALIGNSYQMAYWNEDMPWPRDDGFPLYRAMYNANVLEINPIHSYPWPLVTRSDRPMVTSAEMSIVYRFHEFIINNFATKDDHNNTVENLTIWKTGFDSPGFLSRGADSILRGMLATDIPNFKSGVDESFRSAGCQTGSPLDLVVWSIVHEREQGLPTFNEYFRGYNVQEPLPSLTVKIRKTFEEFSSDPEVVAKLKHFYKTPDDVDFVVGVQLEEELFPGTTMPVSALIPSLFSLFGVGNSDRFSPGFAVMRCILIDKPWSCRPSNAIEELIWAPNPSVLFPHARWYDPFWMNELDFAAHGTNLLFRLITENSGALCVQKNPLFPYDPHTNPILCEPDTSSRAGNPTLWSILSMLSPSSMYRALTSPFSSWVAIREALSWKNIFPSSTHYAIDTQLPSWVFTISDFIVALLVTSFAGIASLTLIWNFKIRHTRKVLPIKWSKRIFGAGRDVQKNAIDSLWNKNFGKEDKYRVGDVVMVKKPFSLNVLTTLRAKIKRFF